MKWFYVIGIVILLVFSACRITQYQSTINYEKFDLYIVRSDPPVYKLTNASLETIEVEIYCFIEPVFGDARWKSIFTITIPPKGTAIVGNIGYAPKLLFKTMYDNTIVYEGYEAAR